MASGVKVSADCIQVYQDMKMNHMYRYCTFKLNDGYTEITVDKKCDKSTADQDEPCDHFAKEMREARKHEQCRFAFYDFPYEEEERGHMEKILFVYWAPEDAKIKQKMVYSASKSAFLNALSEPGIKSMSAHEDNDLHEDSFIDALGLTKAVRKGRKH